MLGKSEGNKKFKTSVHNLPQYSLDLPVDMAYSDYQRVPLPTEICQLNLLHPRTMLEFRAR